ncbi:MAG: phage scaffolding protein [Anaerolineales bacterium]|nr:phage scaffolding protein [Anaerolineales bacterium]
MKKSDLEKLGLTAEAIKAAGLPEDLHEQLLKLNGQAVEAQKAKTTAAEDNAKALQDQLDQATAAIKGFENLKPDELKQSVEEWKKTAKEAQEAAKKAAEDADSKLKAQAFDHALDGALTAAKVKNTKAAKALLKLDLLQHNAEDGSIAGLSEQLEKIKETDDYLFSSDEPAPRQVVKGGKAGSATDDAIVSAMRAGAGLNDDKETK